MDIDNIKNKLIDWMINFVEVPNPKLAGWAPCPYAKQARIRDKISIRFSDDVISEVRDCLDDLKEKDVVVICFDHSKLSAGQTHDIVETLNSELIPDDFVILEDHPDTIETVNGVSMNFGECGLLVIQRLSKLNAASASLKEKDYYDCWKQEALDYVVNWRTHD